MLDLVVTDRIVLACQAALGYPQLEGELRRLCQQVVTEGDNMEGVDKEGNESEKGVRKVGWSLVKELARFLQTREKLSGQTTVQSQYWVQELLKGTQVYHEPPKPKSRNPDLEQRLQNISRDMSNQEYYRMVAGVDPNFSVPATVNPTSYSPITAQAESKETKRQVTAIINIFFSCIAVFVAVFWVSYAFSNDLSVRVLLSLLCTFIVCIAESFLYYRYLMRESNQMRSL